MHIEIASEQYQMMWSSLTKHMSEIFNFYLLVLCYRIFSLWT